MESNKKNKLSFLANLDVIIASVILALLIMVEALDIGLKKIIRSHTEAMEMVQP